jgi:probable selenium-dependent hydroxylase accessory protein YqeC
LLIDGLSRALALRSKEHVALVGGGGKTSLLFEMAQVLRRAGNRVLLTTTTKLWHRQALQSPALILTGSDTSWRTRLVEALQVHGTVMLAGSLLDSAKVQGIDPALADELYLNAPIDYVLVEADGSAGHSVKAHAAHEPVVPASATVVVALLGLDALNRPLEPEIVFRWEAFKQITGAALGEPLTPQVLVRLFSHPAGLFKGAPDHARRIVFLNKLDVLADEKEARDLGDLILTSAPRLIARVVIGSVKKGDFSFVTP